MADTDTTIQPILIDYNYGMIIKYNTCILNPTYPNKTCCTINYNIPSTSLEAPEALTSTAGYIILNEPKPTNSIAIPLHPTTIPFNSTFY